MDKETLLLKRQDFFEKIVTHLISPPSKIDEILGQAHYYILPDKENVLINPLYGDMVIPVKGNFYNNAFNIFYSFWQVSDMLKIGVALNDEDLLGAFVSDSHNEVQTLWNKVEPIVDISHGCVFYEWEFDVPNLYDSYKIQEKYILGVKHMHFRTLRIIHDECHRLSCLEK